MPMTVRYEIFPLTPTSSTATVKFYTHVLRFKLLATKDNGGYNYVSRDGVRIGIVCPDITSYHKETASTSSAASGVTSTDSITSSQDLEARSYRLPPVGIETVYEVDDLDSEWEIISGFRADKEVGENALGWEVMEEVKLREWCLRDFRIRDPVGYYIRITNRSNEKSDDK